MHHSSQVDQVTSPGPRRARGPGHEQAAARGGENAAGRPWLELHDMTIAVALAVAVTLLGALRAGDEPFWADEAYHATQSTRPLGDVVRLLGDEAAHGAYYLGVWAWGQIDTSQWWLRMLSVLGGAATVAATYVVARRWVGRRLALVTCVALVCNPAFLRYLAELRSYSWQMLLMVMATALAVHARHDARRRVVAGYGAVMGCLLSLNVFTVFVVVPHTIAARLWQRPWRRAIAALVGAAVTMAPFVVPYATSRQLDWIPPLTWDHLVWNTELMWGGVRWLYAIAAGMVLLAVRLVRRRDPFRSALVVSLVCVAATPVALALVSLVQPVYLSRYLTPLLPLALVCAVSGYALAAGVVADRLLTGRAEAAWRVDRRHVDVAVAGVITAACLVAFPGHPAHDLTERPNSIDDLAAVLHAEVGPGESVRFASPIVLASLGYYGPWGDAESRWLTRPDRLSPRPDGRWESSTTEFDSCVAWAVWRASAPGRRDTGRAAWRDAGVDITTIEVRGITIDRLDNCG